MRFYAGIRMLGKSWTTGNLTVSQLSILIVEVFFFSFSWGHFNSQEKLKTMLMRKFGVTNKEHYIILVCYGIICIG